MSMRKLLLIGLLGFSFIFTIFTLRALSSGGFFLVDVYSIFSEFMGVNATIGWGYEYNMANSPMALLISIQFYKTFISQMLVMD